MQDRYFTTAVTVSAVSAAVAISGSVAKDDVGGSTSSSAGAGGAASLPATVMPSPPAVFVDTLASVIRKGLAEALGRIGVPAELRAVTEAIIHQYRYS